MYVLKGRTDMIFQLVVAISNEMGGYSDASMLLKVGLKKFRISFTDKYFRRKKIHVLLEGNRSFIFTYIR